MLWKALMALPLLLPLLLPLPLASPAGGGWGRERREGVREEVREMGEHGYRSYMRHAFPKDELNPVGCSGRGSDKGNIANINLNDVLGDFSLTLIDTMDTLAIMGHRRDFHQAVRTVIDRVSFDLDSLVSVFEVTIRVMGSLLSSHLILTEPLLLGDFSLPGYQDELLWMAHDLGERLLPAFQGTATGLPFPRVHLRHGVPSHVISETCTAGAGTLLLEFALLSRLSGDPRFEAAGKGALRALWQRRSPKDLLGNVLNIQSGRWVHMESGVGAGIDSFYEYLLKAHIFLQDDEYLDMFLRSYRSIMEHIREPSTNVFRNVHMTTGAPYSQWTDSLSSYFPGLQVPPSFSPLPFLQPSFSLPPFLPPSPEPSLLLSPCSFSPKALHGDLLEAIQSFEAYYLIWQKYGMLPERFDYQKKTVTIPTYPLRPELIESAYFLYRVWLLLSLEILLLLLSKSKKFPS